MRVGLDVTPLVLTKAGVARHVAGLLSGLEREPDLELRRYSFAGHGRAFVPVRDVGWYLAALSAKARRVGVPVLHWPPQRAPVRSSVPLVVSIHDLAVLPLPEPFHRW